MKTPSASERGFVNEILRAADRRAEEIVRANLPAIRYGIVDAIDTANRKATVQLPGPGSSSPGFSYPARMVPAVGDLVRVVILPTGDRYVDEDLGALVHSLSQRTVIKDDIYSLTNLDGAVTTQVGGTGAAVQLVVGSLTGHPGLAQCLTGTSTSGRAFLQSGAGDWQIGLGGGQVRFGSIFRVEVLSDATDTFKAATGLGDGVSVDDIVDGVYFRYNSAVNGGRWQGVCVSNSVESTLDSGVAADTGYHRFELDVNAAGTSVEFFIDGTSRGTITTNIPSGMTRSLGLKPGGIDKQAGTTSRSVLVDAYWCVIDFPAR